MKLQLSSALGMTEESVTLHQVLGFDLNLVVHRKGSKRHRRFTKAQNLRNPLLQRALRVASASAARDNSRSATPESIGQKFEEVFTQEVSASTIGPAELDYILGAQLEEAVALVAGWSGAGSVDTDTGQTAPCTPENVRELLEDPTPLPEGHEHAGAELGETLIRLILEAAENGALLRAAAVADGEKAPGLSRIPPPSLARRPRPAPRCSRSSNPPPTSRRAETRRPHPSEHRWHLPFPDR